MQFDLSVIIKQYPQALTSRTKLASILHDLYPTEKYLTNIVLAAYETGVTEQLRTAAVIDTMLTATLIRQLESDYGMTAKSAEQGIQLWAVAYGKSIPAVSPAFAAPQRERLAPKPQPKPVIVKGSASDYELEALEDGTYAIKKYRGFGEANTVIPTMIGGKQITVVDMGVFENCQEMKTLVVSEGIKELRACAFGKCSNLEDVLLPVSLTVLGGRVFEDTALASVCIPQNVKIIGESCFSGCKNLRNVVILEGVTQIGSGAFCGCSNLEHIEIPEGVTEIGSSAFSCCSVLEHIEIPATALELGSWAFCGCGNLHIITLNEGLRRIGELAFYSCDNLTEILLPSTVTEIEDNIKGFDIFGNIKYIEHPGPVVYCYAGTKALEYAREHGYPIKNAAELQ